ncbi:hypothetical protein DPMN_051844 [Dreissena polymorpha]|uniref:Laminin G domain-containing protein n=2 Tax=Dreissena polymorpha TaxID=45954 RepID=A0A9D4CIK3_DREPO|nr:hypothetical protein DPMN_051844 [Dreissena polymorpha]
MTSKTFTLILIIPFLILDVTWALNFLQSSNTYARFPKWNACKNASISFEFRTRFPSALLMYTDDNGVNDFLEIMIVNGSVRLRMNFVDGKDNPIEMIVGQRMGDFNWHRVEVRRNRMETLFYVDHFHDSRVAFGSDFNFGDVSTNNYVFFGGLPQTYGNLSRLSKLSLTSAFYETRFVGEVRNVIYENCTCQPQRVRMIEGISLSREPQEACDVTNNCGACLCISGDERHGCQCQGFSCEHGKQVMHETLSGKKGLNRCA